MVKLVTEKPASERSDAQFKGVRKRKWGKWVSEIRLPNSRERIWLGSYDTAEKAARAFDAAASCLRGHSAKFNFPDTPPNIARGRSLTPSEIQVAAVQFANSEPPTPTTHSEHSKPTSGTETLSVSDARVPLECGLSMVGSFEDALTMNSSEYDLNYEIFPTFDDHVVGSSVANMNGEEDHADKRVQLECELPMVESFKDVLTMNSNDYNLDYKIFPEFYDLTGDVVGSSAANISGEEDDADGILVSESFLWNF
ncbi:ERF018 protein [Hibiscus syriacus]|uniref:ERF018 protein n=1 Tax=Hibiscus syriacus TaxID=106335 RepID=A0A6A3B3K4_HIBSY|nr:ERF018 protein [Hibiscus syriacus]